LKTARFSSHSHERAENPFEPGQAALEWRKPLPVADSGEIRSIANAVIDSIFEFCG